MTKIIKIPANKKKTLIVNELQNSKITIGKDASLDIIAILNKAWKDKILLDFHLAGEGASVSFLAIIIGKGKNSFDFETNSQHKSKNTKSHYKIKSVLFDESKVKYKGNLAIPKKSQQSNAYLEHHTLMISDKANVETTPCLEIEANDVKAGHAATIGRLDEEQIFYLNSRGLDKQNAKKVLIQGFINEDIEKISDKKTRVEANKELEKTLRSIS